METTSRRSLISEGLEVWAPDYPRRIGVKQLWADKKQKAASLLLEAEDDPNNIPFLSTYSFPRGHTKEDAIPEINTLFIDFDFEGGDYEGDGDRSAWRRDLSHLLVRVRRVAKYVLAKGEEAEWRASLSGHKGVHLFLDFPTLEPTTGNFYQFVEGTGEYATDLMDHVASETRLDDLQRYVDVTSSDLGRLCRAPNTIHGGASEAFGETRYCVPISIEELAEIDVDRYEELTSEPRPCPYEERHPSADVAEVLERYVATASDHARATGTGSDSTVDYSLVEDYKEQSNDDITLDDIEFLTADRPCVWSFYERDDKYQYGSQSHYMEMYCIRELLEHNVPIEVIKDFLDSAPQYDEDYSEQRIKEIISRDYNRFTVEAILRNAPEFAGADDCSLCQRVIQEHEDLQRRFNYT